MRRKCRYKIITNSRFFDSFMAPGVYIPRFYVDIALSNNDWTMKVLKMIWHTISDKSIENSKFLNIYVRPTCGKHKYKRHKLVYLLAEEFFVICNLFLNSICEFTYLYDKTFESECTLHYA